VSVLFVRLLALACAVSVSVSSAAADLAQMGLSSQAEACCRATQGACAGLSAPDDCCKTPQVSHQVSPTSTVAKALSTLIAPLAAPLYFEEQPVGQQHTSAASTFTRTHDPPHLHPVALRI
jgi:hypothetical protein